MDELSRIMLPSGLPPPLSRFGQPLTWRSLVGPESDSRAVTMLSSRWEPDSITIEAPILEMTHDDAKAQVKLRIVAC